MKVVFIQSDMRERFSFMYLSAMLKQAGYNTEVFIVGHSKYYVSSDNFDIYCFSSSTLNYEDDLKYAKRIKNKNSKAFIVFGGAHATFNPDKVIKESCIDAICIGEGFDAIVEIANNIKRKNILNMWFKKNTKKQICLESNIIKNNLRPKKNINNLPMPNYDLYYKKYPELANKPTKQVYIVSGCPAKLGL